MAYSGYGSRMRLRLLEMGYRKPDGGPDVQRFCWDFRFNANHVHQWLSEKITPFKDLIRLCTALDCSAEWLLTGNERKGETRDYVKKKPLSRSHRREQELARAI